MRHTGLISSIEGMRKSINYRNRSEAGVKIRDAWKLRFNLGLRPPSRTATPCWDVRFAGDEVTVSIHCQSVQKSRRMKRRKKRT